MIMKQNNKNSEGPLIGESILTLIRCIIFPAIMLVKNITVQIIVIQPEKLIIMS